MLITINANAAVDRLIFIPEFRPETVIRIPSAINYVGGKGFDTSVALSGIGAPNLAMGFVAGDQDGKLLVSLLEKYGIQHNIEWVEGVTRIAYVIVEQNFNRHTHIITNGCTIPDQAAQNFLPRYRANLHPDDWVIASGSLAVGLPFDFYNQIIEIAHQTGAKVLIDTSDQTARQTISSQPDILKMNRDEFRVTFGESAEDIHELTGLACSQVERYQFPALVLTLGDKGILAVTPEGNYYAYCPKQKSVNAAGAGDAASAALAWRFSQKESWKEALRWAAAVSAACVLTEGTAEVRLNDVHELLPVAIVEQI